MSSEVLRSTDEQAVPATVAEVRKINKDTYSEVPWANGLGKTYEVYQFTKQQAAEALATDTVAHSFVWKITMSKLEDSCTFPFQNGYSKLITRLQGGNLLLTHNNRAHSQLIKKRAFYEFNGDWLTTSEITEPCTDLMITYATDMVDVSAQIVDTREETIIPLASHTATVLFCINEPCSIAVNDTSVQLQQYEALILNEGYDELENDLECSITSMDSNKISTIACIHVAIDSDIESMHNNDAKPKAAVTPVKLEGEEKDSKGRRKLKLVSSKNYSVVSNDDRWKWQRRSYVPPAALATQSQTLTPPPTTIDTLDLSKFEAGVISTAFLNLTQDGFGEWVKIPLIIAKGVKQGPVLGLTAALHGNELNGVPCIHRLMSSIQIKKLKGTVVACPCVNTPGYLNYKRFFRDNRDLNRNFPGKKDGFASQAYCHAILKKLVSSMDYLIDLHTASFGRVNSFYVRADMNDEACAAMTKLCNPQIILHNAGQDGTLRGAATQLGIKSITVEIGNPHLLQDQFISWTYAGLRRVMNHLNMYAIPKANFAAIPPNKSSSVLCVTGYWIYTSCGGVLQVFPTCNSHVKEGELIARVKNIFGNIVEEIFAPSDAYVIGRSSNPVAYTGDRVVHLGIEYFGELPLPEAKGENY